VKPILFRTDMAQAILREVDPKTNTRRVILPQPVMDDNGMWRWKDCQWMDGGLGIPQSAIEEYAPYKPGDALWVRETWQYVDNGDENSGYVYKASEDGKEWEQNCPGWKWRPSIYMPRKAARIFLRVTDVRAERLQDITAEDAIAEGVEGVVCTHPNISLGICTDCYNTGWLEHPLENFGGFWNETYAKRNGGAYAWTANPWVWVYEFKRITKEEAERE